MLEFCRLRSDKIALLIKRSTVYELKQIMGVLRRWPAKK
jgi:hypothetical protein